MSSHWTCLSLFLLRLIVPIYAMFMIMMQYSLSSDSRITKLTSCVRNCNLVYEFWVLHCPDADQVLNPSAYVSDYCFFKRSQYPQLELIHLKPEETFKPLKRQELVHKFVETGTVLLTWATLKNVDMVSKFEI